MNQTNYVQDDIYLYYDKYICDLMKDNRKMEAQDKAFEWLQEYERSLCITVPWNWKISKKQMVAHFFGKTPSIYLYYDDDLRKGIEFVVSHSDYKVRCSFHRYDTACHSESYRININTLEWLKKIKDVMREKDIIDIFTECSTSKTTCFRRFSLQFNEEISYEMGYGQAMYVFETESGKHDVAGVSYKNNKWDWREATDLLLTEYLKLLVGKHEQYLAMKTQCICYYLGIPQISIEGYFDTAKPDEPPIIVDIDLPFDKVFF